MQIEMDLIAHPTRFALFGVMRLVIRRRSDPFPAAGRVVVSRQRRSPSSHTNGGTQTWRNVCTAGRSLVAQGSEREEWSGAAEGQRALPQTARCASGCGRE